MGIFSHAAPTLPEATTPEPVGLLSDEVAVGGLAPEAVDVEDVLADTGDGYLQEAVALSRFEENPLLLGQPMPDPTIANLPTGRLPATQSLDVILIRLGHREHAKREGPKCKWVGGKGAGR